MRRRRRLLLRGHATLVDRERMSARVEQREDERLVAVRAHASLRGVRPLLLAIASSAPLSMSTRATGAWPCQRGAA